jgi:TRAP-type mannitol/chloroaromatic compound transport system permease small subunit
VLRYAFNNSSIALQELEWHLFSAMFLLSIAYGLQNDTHVRVDVFYLNFSPKTQALINIIGSVVFKTPKITATPAKVKATGKPTISNNKVAPNMTKPII